MFFPTDYNLWWVAAELLLYLLLFATATSLVIFLLRAPMRQYKSIDLLLFKKIDPLRSERNNRIMLLLTWFGKHYFLVPAILLLVIGFIIFGRHYWIAFRIFVMSASSLALMFLLKNLFRRRRPQTPLLYAARGKSFPSGHAIMAVNFYGLLLYMILQTGIDPLLKILAAVLIILFILGIGFSRIYLQVHYTSDVLAGFIIGLCWFYTSLAILARLSILLNQ